MKFPRIAGYTYKQLSPVQLLIKDELSEVYSDEIWLSFCQELFHKTGGEHTQKQTTQKTIFTMRVPPGDSGDLCVVKKYTSRGFIKSVKDMLRHSRAFHEFQTAISIAEKGILTPEPLVVAEYVSHGRVSSSLLITQFIADAYELKKYFINPQRETRISHQVSERRKVIDAFGTLTAKIFNSGIYQDDYALNNFMVKQEDGGVKIYFIDFERVAIKKRLYEQEKTKLLAKLNRVGCEVTVKDRLRFLTSYLREAAGPAKELKQYARELQRATISMLKRDVRRGRITSVYTAEEYKKFDTGGCHGICQKGYREQDLVNQVRHILHHETQDTMSLNSGLESHVLKLVPFKKGGAAKMWAAINALKLAGFSIDLPQGYIETKSGGFLFFKIPESGTFLDFEAMCKVSGATTMNFLKINFPAQLKSCRDLLATL